MLARRRAANVQTIDTGQVVAVVKWEVVAGNYATGTGIRLAAVHRIGT